MPDIASLNAVDYAVIAVLILSGIMATFRGLTREVMGLIGWGLAVVAGRFGKPVLIDRFGDLVDNETATEMLGFFIPFVAVVVIWFFLANITAPGVKKITFGAMDRTLGFLFGVIRGVLIITIAYMAALLLMEREDRFPERVLSSASITPARVIASSLVGYAPEVIRESIEGNIPDDSLNSLTNSIGEQTDELGEKAGEAADQAKETLLPDEQLPIPDVTQ